MRSNGYPKPRCQRNGPSGWSGLPRHPGRVGDLTVAQAKQLFIPMREGGFGLASAELQAEPAMMASWASCAARVTARIGLGGIDDLTAEIPGLQVGPVQAPGHQARSW